MQYVRALVVGAKLRFLKADFNEVARNVKAARWCGPALTANR